MSDKTNESLNDVLADMRADAASRREGASPDDPFVGFASTLDSFVERIKAAHKREVECKLAFFEGLLEAHADLRDERDKLKDACRECSVKNMNHWLMRNALGFIRDSDDAMDSVSAAIDAVKRFRKLAEDAIKASPRNCDKFHTADEAMAAYAASLGDGRPELGGFAHWAFDQAEGGEK